MFNTRPHDEAGLRQCGQCGQPLASPLMFCPHCGTNQLASQSEALAAPAPEFLSYVPPHGFANRLRASLHMLVGHSPDDIGDEPPAFYYPPDLRMRRLRHSLYVCGALAALVVVGCFVIPDSAPRHRTDVISAPVSGTIDPPVGGRTDPMNASLNAQSVPPPARSIDIANMNVAPMQNPPPADTDILGLHDDSLAGAPATAPLTHGATTGKHRADAGGNAATAAARDLASHGDGNRDVATARTDLSRNSLWPARRALTSALAADPHNADALRMRADLTSRERERDSLIKQGQQCARNGDWSCAREYAQRAASMDTSSRDAKRLLARASGTRHERYAHRDNPELLARLHDWFQQSVAQASPRRPSDPWGHP